METEALIAELERLKDGAPLAENRVLNLISRTTLFLVAEGDVDAVDDDNVTVKVRITQNNGVASAYLFSSNELLRSWCDSQGIPSTPMPVAGADLAMLLPKDTSIEIDPGSTHWVILTPKQLAMLNDPIALLTFRPPSDEDDGFQSVIPPEAPQPVQVYQPAPIPQPAPSISKDVASGKKRFVARNNPTTLFSAPQIERPLTSNIKQKSSVSSTLKKIIRSGGSSGEGGEGQE